MADKKLNEVTKVTSTTLANVQSFLAVMKNGSIQQMSKEDMASVVGGLLVKDNSYISNLHNTSAFKSQGSIGANQKEAGMIAGPAWFRIISNSAANNSALISIRTAYTTVLPRTLIFVISGGGSQGWVVKKINQDSSIYFKKIRVILLDTNKYAVDILGDWGSENTGYIFGSFAINNGFVFSEDQIPVVSSELPAGETLVQEIDLQSL